IAMRTTTSLSRSRTDAARGRRPGGNRRPSRRRGYFRGAGGEHDVINGGDQDLILVEIGIGSRERCSEGRCLGDRSDKVNSTGRQRCKNVLVAPIVWQAALDRETRPLSGLSKGG